MIKEMHVKICRQSYYCMLSAKLSVVLVIPRNNLIVQIQKATLDLEVHIFDTVEYIKYFKVFKLHLWYPVDLIEGANNVNHLSQLYCACIKINIFQLEV